MKLPDLVQLMKERAETVQAAVTHIASYDDVCRYTVSLTKRRRGGTIAAVGLQEEAMDGLKKQCESNRLVLLNAPFRDHADNIHTAVTVVNWGIAETGTLVLDSASEDIRLATMLAEIHVAILPADRIKADAVSLEKDLDEKIKTEPSTYLAFITGASRTADIERVLAIGVHGPQELHILIMGDYKE